MTPSEQDDPASPGGPVTPPPTPPPSPASGTATTAATLKPTAGLTPGQILGNRYRIAGMLGRGGMGEVWRAYDLKLQVDVALKSIRVERFPGDKGLELLRREVRSAREVMSPNVCRIFDLVDSDGLEFISMEHVDGETLLDVIRKRGPLELQEATRIASQFLAGLEAIHGAELVHRDVKPENIMITRTNRVVLMDFGVAKGVADDQRGTIAGTPAYMAPEQLRGEALDARADIFAAGVVLAEMIAPDGVRDPESRESLWDAVREAPAKLFESPWRRVLERALSAAKTQRYGSARELARALEEVTLRVAGAEDKHPYPGLESFTEADAEFFFGRELEVEAVWKKLQRANLLAIIGPSGAGKSSFLQAGLLPAKPAGWKHVLVRPGAGPFKALARALTSELAGDPEALRELIDIDDADRALAAVRRWRSHHPQALIIVDQFEELFTLCRPEVQAAFADLLGRVATEADVHVLLSMRDDFLIRCNDHSGLAPIATNLTMLTAPTGGALRRALIQPALLCGYRFEDESLADEMLAAIEGERAALPMLAFAAARLWEERDRERGLLTREAYERIGGVSGALAQHAEATLERIGSQRENIVREIFRNLITSQNTRLVRERDELLSVFPDRTAAESVLNALVDARLLTSFEISESSEGSAQRRRIEIVHESLLTNWPRLVRWQTQDIEGAQLRDQLRQAAQLWKERNESDDLLWTGTAYREFELWRDRYPGSLAATEEAFARAMTARNARQRRRRRTALVTTFALLLAVIVVIGASWRKESVARRASEASKLLALARMELDRDPSAALAYAVASLERSDLPAARHFAIEALARNPVASVAVGATDFSINSLVHVEFSPDGKWLVAGGTTGVHLFPRDGSASVMIAGGSTPNVRMQRPQFAGDSDRIVFTSNDTPSIIRVWSISEKKEVHQFKMEGVTLPLVRGDRIFFITDLAGPDDGIGTVIYPAAATERTGKWTRTVVRVWSFDEKEPTTLARWDAGGITDLDIDRDGRWVAYPKGPGVFLRSLDELASGRERRVGTHTNAAGRVRFDPSGARLASSDGSTGEIRIWSSTDESETPLRVIAGGGDPLCGLWFSPSGERLAAAYATPDKDVRLWDLTGPRDADPVVLRRGIPSLFPAVAFDPTEQWMAVGTIRDIAFWPLTHRTPFVLRGSGGFGARMIQFSPDGKSLAAAFYEGGVRIWSLSGEPTRDLWKPKTGLECIAFDPLGRFIVSGTRGDGVYQVSLTDGRAHRLAGSPPGGWIPYVAVSPDGRRVAGNEAREENEGVQRTRVWDLESGTSFVLNNSTKCDLVLFTGDDRLWSVNFLGEIRTWNLDDESDTVAARTSIGLFAMALARDGRFGLVLALSDTIKISSPKRLIRLDLENHTERVITTHGNNNIALALDAGGTILATCEYQGNTVRVGPSTGEEPHLLTSAAVAVVDVAVSPDGKWIASSDNGEPVVYLWPMPSGQPFHTLPYEDFLRRLRNLTCLQVVDDRTSANGYRLDPRTFAGWEKVPTW